MQVEREDWLLFAFLIAVAAPFVYPHLTPENIGPVEQQCRNEAAAVEQLDTFKQYGASCNCIAPDKVPDRLVDATRSADLVENRTVSLYFIHCTYDQEAPLHNYFPVRKVSNQSVDANSSVGG